MSGRVRDRVTRLCLVGSRAPSVIVDPPSAAGDDDPPLWLVSNGSETIFEMSAVTDSRTGRRVRADATAHLIEHDDGSWSMTLTRPGCEPLVVRGQEIDPAVNAWWSRFRAWLFPEDDERLLQRRSWCFGALAAMTLLLG